MDTINDQNEAFDYAAYMREHGPEEEKITRGLEARRKRYEAAKAKFVIRIDEDLEARLRRLAPAEQDYEKIVNRALREWLAAQDVKELVRGELRQMVQQALAAA